MNKHGQVAIFGIMMLIVIVILALNFAPVLKESTDIARNETTETTIGLNCSDTTISDYDKAGCIAIDLNPFLYIGILLGIAGAVAGAKILIS